MVEVIVEGTSGSAVCLAIYNFPGLFQASENLLSAYFPLGQLLLIREPWMKQPGVAHGSSIIRVDSPTDVVFLSGNEPVARDAVWDTPIPRTPHLTESATRLKAIGNDYFKAKFFIPAARVWSLAIEKDKTLPELYLNRAQAYIALEWYGAALRDATTVLESHPGSNLTPKAMFRAARAEYGLGRYSDALLRFQLVEDNAARDWEFRCCRRVLEVEGGEYDWAEIFRSSQGPTRPSMLHLMQGQYTLRLRRTRTGDVK